ATAGIAGYGSIPSVSASGGATRSRVSTVGPTPLPSSAAPVRTTLTANIEASYEIDLWKRISSLNAAARADLLTSEFARDTARISVLSNVATAYFTLRALDQQLAIAQKTVALREDFLKLTRAQFTAGVVSELDVNRADANLATARAVIPDLKSQVAQTENLLQILSGSSPGPIVRSESAASVKPAVPPEVPVGVPSTLLERRPDLRQAESALVSANARLKAVKASLFPTISLTGALGSQSAAFGNLFSGPAQTWSFGLGLLQPIIDANRNKYQVQIYTAREQQAILAYQQTVTQAFREVGDALAARSGYSEALRVQDEQLAALRAARDQVAKRYAAGYSSYFEVIDADRTLFDAELARVQVYRNTMTSLVQLYKALGGGWQVADAAAAGTAR
ncbi:MAG: efflux transporter outer membrane subunit, partial [Betaproteobacteria bacterium]|nr:efflux transporter outer membrane subunit [Betaproteobacteria bacterium]